MLTDLTKRPEGARPTEPAGGRAADVPRAGMRSGPFGRLARDRRGAAAVEFALVGSALVMTIVFLTMVGLFLYINQALDRATDLAARQIMIGTVQKANLSQAAFRTTVVCPALPAPINCDDVIVNVQTLAKAAQPGGYYTLVNANQTGLVVPALSNATAQFNPGTQGAYVYLQVVYPLTILPAFMTSMLGANYSYKGAPAYLTVATAAFRNEQY